MKIPRRLYSTVPYEQTTAETLRAEGEEDHLYLIAPEGGELHDLDAARLGIQEYLAAHPVEEKSAAEDDTVEPSPPEEKAVAQSTVEDKAVEGPGAAKTPAPPPAPDAADDPGQTRARGRRAVDFPPETPRS